MLVHELLGSADDCFTRIATTCIPQESSPLLCQVNGLESSHTRERASCAVVAETKIIWMALCRRDAAASPVTTASSYNTRLRSPDFVDRYLFTLLCMFETMSTLLLATFNSRAIMSCRSKEDG